MEARLTLRRLLSIATLSAAVVSMSACGGGSPAHAAAKDPPLVKYSDKYLSFTHPAAWKASPPTGPGLGFHFNPIVYLSTQRIGSPCSVQGNTTTCGWPVKRLQPGDLIALWQIPYAPPTAGTVSMPGKLVRVDGKPARRVESAAGICHRIGADRTIDVLVENSLEFTACLRGPGVAQAEKSVNALLASVKFVSQ